MRLSGKHFMRVAISTLVCLIAVFSIFAIGVLATEPDVTLTIEKHNLRYSDNIHILYAVSFTGFDPEENSVTMDFLDTDGTIAYTAEASDVQSINGKQYVIFNSKGIYAKNLDRDLVCRAKVTVNGKDYVSKTVRYSALEYLVNALKNRNLSPYHPLFRSLIGYGAESQKVFYGTVDHPIDAEDYFTFSAENATVNGYDSLFCRSGDTVTLQPEEIPGGTFLAWIDGSGNVVSNNAAYTTTVTEDTKLAAVYSGIHNHCVCGNNCESVTHSHTSENWIPITATSVGGAAKTTSEVIAALKAGGSYYLVADIPALGNIMLAEDATLKICLNGHTFASATRLFTLNNGGMEVDLCDCSQDQSGILKFTGSDKSNQFVLANAGSGSKKSDFTLNIYGGTLDASRAAETKNDNAMIKISNSTGTPTVNLYGGKVITPKTTANSGFLYVTTGKALLNIYGGEIDASGTTCTSGSAIHAVCPVNISGGTIHGGVLLNGSASTLEGKVTIDGQGLCLGADLKAPIALNEKLDASSRIVLSALGESDSIYGRKIFTGITKTQGKCFTVAEADASLYIDENNIGYYAPSHIDHCICGGLGAAEGHSKCTVTQDWVALTQANMTLGADGAEIVRNNATTTSQIKFSHNRYYLTEDIKIDYSAMATAKQLLSTKAELDICLNGHTLDMGALSFYFWAAENSGATLNICDCKGGGAIVSSGRVIEMAAQGCKNTVNQYGGRLESTSASSTAYTVELKNGTYRLYDGEIALNGASGADAYAVHIDPASNIVDAKSAVFEMYGGRVTAENARAVALAPKDLPALFTMNGGEIDGTVYLAGKAGLADVGYSCFTQGGGTSTAYLVEGGALDLHSGTVSGEISYQSGAVILAGSGLRCENARITVGSGQMLKVDKNFAPASPMPVALTSGSAFATTDYGKLEACFISADASKTVVYKDGKLQILAGAVSDPYKEPETTDGITDQIVPVKISDNQLLVHQDIYNYYNSAFVSPIDYTTTTVTDYFNKSIGTAVYKHPLAITLKWSASSEIVENAKAVNLYFSTDSGFAVQKTEVFPIIGGKTEYSVRNLFAGTRYYWYVAYTDYCGNVKKCTVSDFTTDPNQPTIIDPDDVGVPNIRDVGGRKIEGTNTYMNRGLVYRGAQFEDASGTKSLTLSGAEFLRTKLKLQSDVDFRKSSEMGSTEFSTTGVNLLWRQMYAYNRAIIDEDTRGNFITAYRTFADPSVYPAYFHCVGGLDRTGTMATMLQLTCGVSEADAVKDFELSTFLSAGRYRNNTVVTSYPADGYAQAIAHLKTFPGDTMQQKVQNYLHANGVSWQEIDNIVGIHVGNDAIFTADSLSKAEIAKGEKVNISVMLRDSAALSSVKVGGTSIAFTKTASNGTTVYSLDTTGLSAGDYTMELLFGTTLRRFEFTVK